MANPAASLPGTRTIVLPREPRRGLFGHMLAVLLQPVAFFRQMPTTRQWIGAALIILIVVGLADVRRTSLLEANTGGVPDAPIGVPADIPMSPDIVPGGDLPIAPPIPSGIIPGDTPSNASITDTTVTALIAASSVVLAWVLQAVVLLPVPMFNAHAPSLARNLQIAVWATVPLGLLAFIQLIYYAAGGEAGQIGVALLLERWEAYGTLPTFVQALLHSLSLHLTLFWLWSLVLLFIGARQALSGRWWAVVLVWLIWVLFVLLLPVLTGTIQPLQTASTATESDSSTQPLMPDMSEMPTDGIPPGIEPESGVAPSNVDVVPERNAP